MMYIIRLAWRNALRNRRRSFLTLVAIFFGVAVFIFAQSLIAGIERTMVGLEIDAEQGHLRVATESFFADEDYYPLDAALPDPTAVQTMLKNNFPGVQTVQRISFSVRLGDGHRNLRCRGMVINPSAYTKVLHIGALKPPVGERSYVFLGADLAAAFGLKVGDRVVLQAKTQHGTRNALSDLMVAGLVAVGHPLVDNFTVFVPESVGADLLDIADEDDLATEVIARFTDPDDAGRADALLSSAKGPAFETLAPETWREKTEYIIRFNEVRRLIFNILTFVIMLMAGVGVANTALMSALERTTEIGTFLALGMSRNRVVVLLLVEAAIIAIAGTVSGLLVAGIPAYYFERVGIPFPEASQGSGAAVPMPATLYLDVTTGALMLATVMGIGVALLSAWYPARRTAQVNPVEALRVEG